MGCSQSTLSLEPHFEAQRRVGSGTFAAVWKCTDLASGEDVAVKLIPRGFDDFDAKHISYEIQLQALIASPRVVQLKQIFLTRAHLGLVLEYIPGGTLDRYCRQHPPDEATACFLLHQLTACLSFLHKHQIVHRDLKLSNIMVSFETESRLPRLKLIDFGCAKRWKRRVGPSGMFHTSVGTPAYMSPQLLKAAISNGRAAYDGAKVDIWCLGIMLIQIFSGTVPYSADKYQQAAGPVVMNDHLAMLERLRDMEKGEWRGSSKAVAAAASRMSPELLDLLDSILDPMESSRITLEGITAHPWMTQGLPEALAAALRRFEEEAGQEASPQIILNPLAADGDGVCSPDKETGRYQLVDDIVSMAAKGRYVPKSSATEEGQGAKNRMWLLSVQNLMMNMDISKHSSRCPGSPSKAADPQQQQQQNPDKQWVLASNVTDLSERIVQSDPSAHGGTVFPGACKGGGAEQQ